MAGPNFLLGYGERLTERVEPGGKRMEAKEPPYVVTTARNRLAPLVANVSTAVDALPPEACPDDQAVSVVTIHPQFIAKSYFPTGLFREVGLEPVGSRTRRVEPERWTRRGPPEPIETTEIFVSAPRRAFREWSSTLPNWSVTTPGASDLPRIEGVSVDTPEHKLRFIRSKKKDFYLEVVLHASHTQHSVLDAFRTYLELLAIEGDLERRIHAGRLCFIPVRSSATQLRDLASFAFLRVAREMPKLRRLAPLRTISIPAGSATTLPSAPPIDPDLKAAVFDGGLNDIPELRPWVNRYDAEKIGPAMPEGLHHGACVTSAVLFGPLTPGTPAERPYAHIDHYRVIDDRSGQDIDLYDVLPRIRDVLQSRQYQFVNLSIGPELPVDDDEVHPWTAVLDELCSSGDILTTIAAGNNGEGDATLGFNRVQVPSDSVNGLGVGSADTLATTWSRAHYSAVGPGRCPGLVKPDVLAFGGVSTDPYWVVNPDDAKTLYPQMGTSFASPSALRLALGVRAHFGDRLTPLAIKALLIHCTDQAPLERSEQGWGRIPASVEDLVICPDGTARIVYQGELSPAQHLRAPVPLPDSTLRGMVTITATICFATAVDPEDPASYTRSGLDVVFRPHDEKFGTTKDDQGTVVQSTHPKTASFFQLRDYSTEKERRQDAHKWETVLHQRKKKRAASLRNPAFDIHFAPRAYGAIAPAHLTDRIRYALIITIENPHTLDLYDRIVQRYRTQIQPLTPLIQIPIRT